MSNISPKNTDENGRDKNGRFAHGNNGKPKGATHKTTKELREFITSFLNEKSFEIVHIWDSLDDKDKATLFLHLARLVMPKQTDEPDTDKQINSVEVKIITPEQIDKLIDKL
jgi:hypothetical protein